MFKPRGSSTANVSVFNNIMCFIYKFQATRVISVNDQGGVKVRIPGRDSSVSSVSLDVVYCVFILFLGE